jgi:ligand-binding sensor domain-containing protein/serine phosphatase RsbU (regulator of sigma subunit)
MMKKNTWALAMIFISLFHISHAQSYKFRQFGVDAGLCHHTIYAVTQDKNGFVWFATGMGLCRYDGFRFSSPNEEIPAGNIATAFKDKDGNLWFGYNDGLVVKYDGAYFSVEDSSQNNTVKQITQSPAGDILIATQNSSIICISGEIITHFSQDLEDKLIYSIQCIDETQLLLGCDDGLYVCRYENAPFRLQRLTKIEKIGDDPVCCIIPETGSARFWVATESNGLFNVDPSEQNFSVNKIAVPVFEETRLQSVSEDQYGDLWISTMGKGLFRLSCSEDLKVEKLSNYNSKTGLGSDDIKQVFFDSQQNLWVGTYGKGVACLTNLAISFLKIPAISTVTDVLHTNSEDWVGGIGAIAKITDQATTVVFDRKNGVPNDRITALYADDQGVLWIGTEKNGLFRLAKNGQDVTPYYSAQNSLSNTIQAISSLGRFILYASRNGVIILDTKDRSAKTINTYNGLPHNNVKDIYRDSKGVVWIATNSSSILSINHWIDPDYGEKKLESHVSEVEFSCLGEDQDGNIWAGTSGSGVFLFDRLKDSVYQFTSRNGLKSDFCYAIVGDEQRHIWTGHRLGLSRIDVRRHTVATFGVEYGIEGDVNPNAMNIKDHNELMVGFTDGVLLYNIASDKQEGQAPLLNMVGVTVGDKSYQPNEPLSLPYNRYRLRLDFIGLQYQNPNIVSYQYILQGYDTDWSEPSSERSVLYPRLEDGEYKFLVQACNQENCSPITTLYTINIRKPFWKTRWFIFLAIAAILGGVYAIVVLRERTHKQQQEYLERELAARTKEVFEQKEELEVKNRDITDSINYAQRIQFSVLPTTKTLLDNCSDAFIFYRPRDIVSGDFYWFDYFPDKNVILVVCADSTGHGVPGAFMSLIGTTLIKDIVMRPEIDSPIDILHRLDENIQSTLNQNQESEQSNDGMDVIVCEINTKTHHVRVASAMRPFVVYQNDVRTIYKGSHVAIGGQYLSNKTFELTELQLAPGDTIYMFTDGYPDQFGGPAGKKFKMNRLQSILNDIYKRDMDEQLRVLRENFELWKGNIEQVDDVLMIGVRL